MDLLAFFIVAGQLFAITDPIGNLPIFYSITDELETKERHSIFVTAAIFAFTLLIVFTFLGDAILNLFNIGMSDFKIAGGILILVIAIIILVRGSWSQRNVKPGTLGAVPLGCPLLVGPGAITTSMVALVTYGIPVTLSAIAANFIISFFILFYAERIFKIIGENGAEIIARIMVILLAAIAVSFIHSGIAMWIVEFKNL